MLRRTNGFRRRKIFRRLSKRSGKSRHRSNFYCPKTRKVHCLWHCQITKPFSNRYKPRNVLEFQLRSPSPNFSNYRARRTLANSRQRGKLLRFRANRLDAGKCQITKSDAYATSTTNKSCGKKKRRTKKTSTKQRGRHTPTSKQKNSRLITSQSLSTCHC